MVGRRYCLDTSVLTRILNAEPEFVARISPDDYPSVPVIVIGELRFGAYKSTRTAENLARVTAFCNDASILPITDSTTMYFGQIKCQLSRIGRPIPDNDIWIAASAIEHGLPLATRDKHFLHVDGLTVESW